MGSVPSSVVLPRREFDAVLFDLDGVVTRTARVHAAAWKRLFDPFLQARAKRSGEPFVPFSDEDYRRFVDGRPRADGVRCFLESRHMSLPEGSPDDGPDAETVRGMGQRKDTYFLEALKEHGVEVFPDAVVLLERLRAAGFRTAVVSASRNCAAVVRAAGLERCFDARVDGVEAGKLQLPGKPAPDTFLEAARRLEVEPRRAVVLEDAQAGVQAGHRGHFGRVLGVRRTGQAGELAHAGADVEVTDLSTVRVEEGRP